MKDLKQEYKIKAPLKEVWQALIDPKIIDKWGGGPAKMSDKEGEKFTLWGGDIHGENTKVVPLKLLEQNWISGNWDEYSIVRFRLTYEDGTTTVNLVHKGIPAKEFDDIKEGWDIYYLGEIKKLLE
jgi:activator of HSP90 ATPase